MTTTRSRTIPKVKTVTTEKPLETTTKPKRTYKRKAAVKEEGAQGTTKRKKTLKTDTPEAHIKTEGVQVKKENELNEAIPESTAEDTPRKKTTKAKRILPKTETPAKSKSETKAKTKAKAPIEKKKKKEKFTLPPEAECLSSNLRGRVIRAMNQRMFILSRKVNESDSSTESFDVAGSVGNVYTVNIASRISCTCMDHSIRRSYCKHILMILVKVYRLPFIDLMFKSLSTKPDQRIQARQHSSIIDPSVLVSEEIQKKVMGIYYHNHEPESSETKSERRPLDNNDCPICFEEFEEEKINETDYCKVCGNNIHKECFQMWAASKGRNVTCVYCRSNWNPTSESSKTGKKSAYELDYAHVNEGYYANFAKELGLEKKRDNSTYGIK
ncbi:uncharacterized protein B0P05DRAFT_470126 [Gilbertella persicaria]|uniref:uncharacterized protein n=1 Tax=Gilbertella persicaria TaxID=101096 RepID=UPI00221EFF48|nr:uncharacterized protein B0P05DRAFT_470126 [Gilbertella persicaria]KAI8079089.1 hypothetical protein B0P05DRAFT_470126 [Gilbertella persicaria]